jgi:20S proteasome alpha/beta subunit
MTIVAGFPGSNFVVLAADSEEGGGIAKSSVHKIAQIDKSTCKCLIGGAGNGDFIDLAVQHAEEQIPGAADIKTIRQRLENIVTDIYAKRIDAYPEHERNDLAFELLCAIWSKKDGTPRLLRVRRLASLIRRTPESIGIGTYLARYLIATLGSDQMTLPQAMRLAIHVIAQAKKHVAYCGGSTQAMALTSDGGVIDLLPPFITQYETATSLIVEDVAKVLFYATDPIMTGMDGAKLKAAIDVGMAQWATQLPQKLMEMIGLPPSLIAQQRAAAAASEAASPGAQASNPTNSSSDQT